MGTTSTPCGNETISILPATVIAAQGDDGSDGPNGGGPKGLHSVSPVPTDAEVRNLDEEQLKAAIKSEWKKHERLAKKSMGPLFYWLREKLKAQGTRHEGFGAWVAQNLDITRRTADRWADWYGLENGLMTRKVKPTPRHLSKGFESHAEGEDGFYERELRQHGKLINYWLTQDEYQDYEQTLNAFKQHFKIVNDKEAFLKGMQYAGESLGRGAGKSQVQVVAGDEGKVWDNQAIGDPH
jgi:hypothetical protein